MDRNKENGSIKMQRLASNGSTDKQSQFISLFQLMNKELLRDCLRNKKDKPHQT
ncbi:MAG: hypothetical protein ACC657_13145 [Thiohalomonadales bacterium]